MGHREKPPFGGQKPYPSPEHRWLRCSLPGVSSVHAAWQIPQKEQIRFDLLITIHSDGTHTLNPTFVAAITAAKDAYEATLPKKTTTQQNAALPTPPP